MDNVQKHNNCIKFTVEEIGHYGVGPVEGGGISRQLEVCWPI
jgi:hypothetical protein